MCTHKNRGQFANSNPHILPNFMCIRGSNREGKKKKEKKKMLGRGYMHKFLGLFFRFSRSFSVNFDQKNGLEGAEEEAGKGSEDISNLGE